MALVFDRLDMEGFGSFRDKTSIELKPLTLLYGQNSAGKSTIIKSLLLLQQTFEGHRRRPGAQFVFSGEYVDLGSFVSAVSDHRVDAKMSVGVRLPIQAIADPQRNSGGIDPEIIPQGDLLDPQEVSITWEIGIDESDLVVLIEVAGKPLRFEMRSGDSSYRNGINRRSHLQLMILSEESTQNFIQLLAPNPTLFSDSDRLLTDLKSAPRIQVAFEPGLFPTRVRGTYREGVFTPYGRQQIDEDDPSVEERRGLERRWRVFVGRLENQMRSKLSKIAYIGPLRQRTERNGRYYPAPDSQVGRKGEHMLSMLYENQHYVRMVNNYLQMMEMPYSINVDQVSSQETLGSLIHMTLVNGKGLRLALADVGVGYSQVLPLITQSVASRGNLLCIEQPELHLHPAMQSRLADLFIDSATSGSSVQYIIETHSENLILRMMKRIREGRLNPADVQVIYIDQDSTGRSSAIELPLDEHGDFVRPWPHGFFDERLHEIEFD